MPDVGRSDSQRSDSSQRPRVSFNRDVHVKRIGHSSAPRVVGALAGDGEGHLVPAAVRRERPNKLSRRELAAEARRVLAQADSVACTSRSPLDASRFSTLPPLRSRKPARRSLSFREPSKKDKNKSESSSLTDLAGDSELKRPVTSKKSRTSLVRSASDAGKSSEKTSSTKNYASLERPPRKIKSHSDHSDRSPSPSASRIKRNILKKSHSDSETAPLQELSDIRKKKQLSPIIEASPRDDYFAPADAMMHSSQQPPARPALTRGRTVETMVKRLSQDARAPRRPPRGVSPSALLSPGDERRHNNNLPFSYTEPVSPTGSPPAQVIYAEVVVSGGGSSPLSKQTVHTAVPLHSDEDEGLGLTMERHTSSYLNDYKVHDSADFTVDSSGRGRADGMDARRKDLLVESSRYDDGFFQPRHGDYGNSVLKNVSEYHSESRIVMDGGYYGRDTHDSGRKEPPIQPHIINTGDLSSRRDRLESRIESQRKDRFVSSRLNDSSSSTKQELLDLRIIDNNRKYPSDPRVNSDVSYNNRRDFLNSQIDYDRDPVRRDIRHENERNHNNTGRYVETDSHSKKDLFADSGIEVDYRKDSNTSSYKKYDNTSNVKTNDGLTAKILISSPQTPNVTRVDLNGRAGERPSDGEETDDAGRYNYTSSHSKTGETFTSTRLVQEQRRTTEVVPASSVLIRHYTPVAGSKREHPPVNDSEQFLRAEQESWSARKDPEERNTDVEDTVRGVKDPARGTLEKGKVLVEEKSKKGDTKKVVKKKQVSAMDKVKQLFSRSGSDTKTLKKSKKKKDEKSKEEKVLEPEEDPLTSRYTEYKGSNIESDQETLTPLSQRDQHSPPSHRRRQSPSLHRDHSPIHQREYSPPRHRDRSPPHDREYSPLRPRDRHSPPSHRHHQSPNRYRDHHSPSQRREHSPTHHRNHSPLHHRESSPPRQHSPPRYRDHSPPHHRDREHSPSPNQANHLQPPHRAHYRDHSPPSLQRGHHNEHRRHLSSDTEEQQSELTPSRQRLATPTPSPNPTRAAQSSATLTRINNHRNKEQHGGGWFKSLDRLTKRSKSKAKAGKEETVITEDEITAYKQNNNNNNSNNSNKNLRFFGDTDQESVASIPPPMPLQSHRRYKSNSNMVSSSNKLQVPRGPSLKNQRRHHRSAGDVATSSAESTTEGDSSQQSQRSVVYLHAATVGDIPIPPHRNGASGVGRRAQSREELSSVASSHLQPQTRTISRSISVLAPWKPRHYREGMEVHYDNEDNNKNYIKNNGKPPKVPVSQQTSLNSSTMNRINRRKNAENNKVNQQQKQRVSKAISIESLSQKSLKQNHDSRGTIKKRSTLHPATSIESLSHRSSHSGIRQQSRDKSISKKNSALNASAIELNSNNKNYKNGPHKKAGLEPSGKKGSSSKVSRSASMPKDTRVTAGWFKLRNKKQGT